MTLSQSKALEKEETGAMFSFTAFQRMAEPQGHTGTMRWSLALMTLGLCKSLCVAEVMQWGSCCSTNCHRMQAAM